jgi:hypothetical protein
MVVGLAIVAPLEAFSGSGLKKWSYMLEPPRSSNTHRTLNLVISSFGHLVIDLVI